jgi:excisionase family DNA binding protein
MPSYSLEPMFLTRDQAAQVAGVSLDTIRRAINKGALKAKRTGADGGGKYLITREALTEWFNRLADA